MQYNRLKGAWVWLCRIGHCRGFGIQSPWAYRFVRYVVNEHDAYYAYARLKEECPADGYTTKMGCLLFRLANYWQPETIAGLTDEPFAVWRAYVQAGCAKSKFIALSSQQQSAGQRAIVVLTQADEKRYEGIVSVADEQILLVVMDIGSNKAARRLWKQILADDRARTSFDLYYCGVVFFDKQRFKQHYIVNF